MRRPCCKEVPLISRQPSSLRIHGSLIWWWLLYYNTITEPCAHFLLSLMEGLSINFPSNCYRKTVTHDKLIFPSAIAHILTHLHVTIPPSPHFYVIGAISKKSIRRSVAQLTTKRPHVEPLDATPANLVALSSRPFSSSALSSSSQAVISLADIMEKLQHMHADFGSRLDHLSDEMCQMNTKSAASLATSLALVVLHPHLHLSMLRSLLLWMVKMMMVVMLLALCVIMR